MCAGEKKSDARTHPCHCKWGNIESASDWAEFHYSSQSATGGVFQPSTGRGKGEEEKEEWCVQMTTDKSLKNSQTLITVMV